MAHGFQLNKTKKDSATPIQSHIWDQEIITVSLSFCSAKMNITSRSHFSLFAQHTEHSISMHCHLILSRGTFLGCSTLKSNKTLWPHKIIFLSNTSTRNILMWTTTHICSVPLNNSSVYSASTSYGLHIPGALLSTPGNSLAFLDLCGWPGDLTRLKSPTRSIRINSK